MCDRGHFLARAIKTRDSLGQAGGVRRDFPGPFRIPSVSFLPSECFRLGEFGKLAGRYESPPVGTHSRSFVLGYRGAEKIVGYITRSSLGRFVKKEK